jgi:hemerythrin-like metal-binding protein
MKSVETEDGLALALRSIDEGFLWIDSELQVRGANPAYRRLLEIGDDFEMIGRPYSDVLRYLLERGEFVDSEDQESFLDERLRGLREREKRRFERVRPNGTVLSITAIPLHAGGFVYTFLDVTRETGAREQLQRNAKSMVVAMANLSEHRDADTGIHVLRVARLVGQTASKLQLRGQFIDVIDEAFIDHAATASMLHDVGKIATPDRILLKPGPMTAAEREQMKLHTTVGAQMLRQASRTTMAAGYLDVGAEIALTHHEWFDGTGYPQGLAGEAIPLAGRICALADVFDALVSRRPYKAPWTTNRATAMIRRQTGSQFDPTVANAFFEVISDRERVSLVRWDDSMSVGNIHIDEQHQILIDTINQLASAQLGADRAVIAMIIDELVNYAVFHFDYEEALIEAAGYPDVEAHRRGHRGFVSWVGELRDEFSFHRRRKLGDKILGFLRDWLSQHILGEDRKYRGFVASPN